MIYRFLVVPKSQPARLSKSVSGAAHNALSSLVCVGTKNATFLAALEKRKYADWDCLRFTSTKQAGFALLKYFGSFFTEEVFEPNGLRFAQVSSRPNLRPFPNHLGTKKRHVSRSVRKKESTQTGTRTQDQLVKSQLLYQLSYLRLWYFRAPSGGRCGGALGPQSGIDK